MIVVAGRSVTATDWGGILVMRRIALSLAAFDGELSGRFDTSFVADCGVWYLANAVPRSRPAQLFNNDPFRSPESAVVSQLGS